MRRILVIGDLEKQCSKCGKVKHVDLFHIDNSKRCGLTSQCKECRIAKKKEWMQKPETKKMRAKQARKIRATPIGARVSREVARRALDKSRFGGQRVDVFEKYNHECATCRTNKGLCIHHKDCNGRNSKTPNNDIDNLILLCRSCHMKLHRRLEATHV